MIYNSYRMLSNTNLGAYQWTPKYSVTYIGDSGPHAYQLNCSNTAPVDVGRPHYTCFLGF